MLQEKLNDLIADHNRLKADIDALPALWQSQNFTEFRELLKQVLKNLGLHHSSEMEKIFEPMQKQPRLREGGPLCTFFFDSRMTFQPLRIAEKIAKELGLEFTSAIPAELKEYFDENSPLTIPLEEHISQKLIVEALLQFPELENPQHLQTVAKALSFLQDVSNSNFSKEERCLFEFARQLFRIKTSI